MPPTPVAAPAPPTTQARADVAAAREAAAVASSVPAVRAEVVRLADVLDLVLDELERRA